MVKNVLLFSGLLTTMCGAVAQTSETVKIAAGNDIAAAVSAYGMYRLPAFASGTVLFKDGKIAKEVLNYHILNDQVLYISKSGDTLAIALPEEISRIEAGGVVFYYDRKGWLEGIANAGNIHLAVKRKIIIHYEKEGAFGIANSTNGIESYTVFTSNNSSYHLAVSEDAVLKKLTSWWLLTEGGQPIAAGKPGFLNAFPQHRKAISNYLDEHKVNFNKEADLKTLLSAAAGSNN